MRVAEHGAAAVIDKGFRRSTFGEDRVVGFKLYVKILDATLAFGLDERNAIHQILRLDQEAF